MVKTHGLTHVALAVRDAQRSSSFYQSVLGTVETHRGEGWAQIETPESHDVIVLEETVGKAGGVRHFGFRLVDPADIHLVVQEVEKVGGKILGKGSSAPASPTY